MSTFVLSVDPVKVDREFKMIERSRDRLSSFNPMVTKLEDLGLNVQADAAHTPFVDIKDIHLKMFTHLCEYLKLKAMPYRTDVCCFHCTETFQTPPIGVPVEFVPSYYLSTIQSEKDDSVTTMRHPIHSTREYDKLVAKGVTVVKRDYFEVDGNFCSFPCMISYYRAHSDRMEYKNSMCLMERLHKRLYNKPLEWRHAPDIRLLKKFGGHLSIDEFRSAEGSMYHASVSLNRPRFADTDHRATMVPVTKLYTYHGTKY